MSRALLATLLAVLSPALAAAQPDLAIGTSQYTVIRQELERARAEDRLRRTAARLVEQQGDNAALRLFVRGVAAMLAYDRDTAERDLTRSFRQTPSPHAALALTANAIEAGDAHAVLEWVTRGLEAGGDRDPRMAIELQLARAQGVVWLMRRDEHRALVTEAVDRARQIGDARLLALALRARGVIAGEAAKPEALDIFEEAIRLSDGDTAAVGYHLLIMNTFYYPHRPYAEKLEVLDRALRCAREVRDRQLEGRALAARGAALMVLARYGEALRDLTAGDALLRQTGAVRSRAALTGNLSRLFTELGDYAAAEQQARLSYALYRRVGNPWGARLSLDDLGHIALRQGEPALAVARHERVVALSREMNDALYLPTALTQLGLAYGARGQWRRAEPVLREALERTDGEIQTPDQRESARIALADVFRATGRAQQAERAYRQALAAVPGLSYAATLLVRAHHGLAQLESAAGRLAPAIEHYRAALAEIEKTRDGAGRAELQLTYFSDKAALYVDAIDALVESHRRTGEVAHLREALLVAERAKARTLLDAVIARSGSVPDAAITLDGMADALDPSDVLAAFVTGAKRSFLFTLRRDRTITVHTLPARAVLEQHVSAMRRQVSERPRPGADLAAVQRVGARAYTALLAPGLDAGARGKRLIIVADGPLFYAPFEAFTIPESGRYLGEAMEVVRAASASVLGAVRRRPTDAARAARFVAFGDPRLDGAPQSEAELVRALERDGFSFAPLPGSRREIEDAASAFPAAETRIYTRDSFTTESALRELQRPNQIVHFATHAILDERVPARSGIVASATADGAGPAILRARDLDGVSIPVDLVVLSACQTGLGSIVDGEGVLGLAWAFSRAGAGSLMVTLWNVSDAASGTAMAAFYRALAAGHPKSAALHAARRAMVRGSNPGLRHPYFWAGYTLIGNPD